MNKLVLIGVLVGLALASIAGGSIPSGSGGSNGGELPGATADRDYLSQGWITNVFIDNQFACSGSLVSNRSVLTTASCLDEVDYSRVQVVVGPRLNQSYGIKVGKVKLFKNDIKGKATNLAIIYLDVELMLENGLEIVTLPEDNFSYNAFATLVLGNEDIAIKVIECDSVEEENFICYRKESICIYYEGSPLVILQNNKNILIGIANKNYPECGRLRFTNIMKQADWIVAELA